MSLPSFTMRELLQAGIHYGHHPRRWNPKMGKFIFGVRNGVHIINLEKTVPLLSAALAEVQDVVANGGRVLFVGTKRPAAEILADSAQKCGQYYVNHRWLGGMLTNWKTVSASIIRLRELDEKLSNEGLKFTKKERLSLERQKEKLDKTLGGIKEMGGTPDLLFVIDTMREETAVREARKLGIPVVGIVDTNADPDVVDYPIPGNDDAMRSIELYCRLISGAVLDGLALQMQAVGMDLGEAEEIGENTDEELAEFETGFEAGAEKSSEKKAAPKKSAASKSATKKASKKVDSE